MLVADHTGVIDRSPRVAAGPDQVFDLAAFEAMEHRGGRGSKRRRIPIPLVVALVLALVAGGLVAAFSNGVFTPSHPVPTIAGLTVSQARQSLVKDHFLLADQGSITSITVKRRTDRAPGPVARDRIEAGKHRHRDRVAGPSDRIGAVATRVGLRGGDAPFWRSTT